MTDIEKSTSNVLEAEATPPLSVGEVVVKILSVKQETATRGTNDSELEILDAYRREGH